MTDVAVLRNCPPIEMTVPPVVTPSSGLTVVIVGTGVSYLNAAGSVAVPPLVVTATVTVPGAWAGVLTVIFVEL